MEEKMTLSVTQVNLYIKNMLESDVRLSNIYVKGELSNFKLHSSGHMYMSLKDEKGVMRAVMFRSAAAKLNFKPENGMKVVASGRISVYERDGQYQMYIDTMLEDAGWIEGKNWFNEVELLGMRVIDELIQDEVAYYKEIYEQEGLQGLLENLN